MSNSQSPTSVAAAPQTGTTGSNWVVLKFGGTSVASIAGWRCIAAQVRRLQQDSPLLVVCSALAGVTNSLLLLAEGQCDDVEALADTIIARHQQLLVAAGGDCFDPAMQLLVGQFRDYLKALPGTVIASAKQPGKRLHAAQQAQLLAYGELLSTTLGVQLLQLQGVPAIWRNSRELLQAQPARAHHPEHHAWLNAECDMVADVKVQQQLAAELHAQKAQVVLVPGFVAANANGETVLLGRGGSDTSCVYLAVLLAARLVEIWTDVPGLFSANPRQVGNARLLRHLGYMEAQEIAATGARVLHPRCLRPAQLAGIPIHVRSTHQPEHPGTIISDQARDFGAQVKAIVSRHGITLVVMETLGMWHQVGFLADAFAVFRQHGVSVDLVATSESNVTCSVDTGEQLLQQQQLQALEKDLQAICRVRVIPDCAVVSLVGRGIRSMLHRLAPAFEAFEERRILLLTQAANDLNLSVVVASEHADNLVHQLHELLIPRLARIPEESVFGESWQELTQDQAKPLQSRASWYREHRQTLLQLATLHPCAYVYNLAVVRRQAAVLQQMRSIKRVLYAMKANNNVHVLRLLRALGIGFDCVSMDEVLYLQQATDAGVDEILFTPNFAPVTEYQQALQMGLKLTIDNGFIVQNWDGLLRGREVFLRIDPGQGHGHHQKVKTAGVHSKFGIPLNELVQLAQRCQQLDLRVTGLHVHIGSGLTLPDNWRRSAELLLGLLQMFPQVKVIDLGGGLSVASKPGDDDLDVARLDQLLLDVQQQHVQRGGAEVAFWLEPGRFLVSEAGVLLARVTQTKGKGDVRYVGLNTGMNSLLRPALYGAYHDIVNLSRLDDAAQQLVNVVGPICETGDIIGLDRMLSRCTEGDVMLIANAGAYGAVMSNHYNMRTPAPELILGMAQ
ncbi:MAG: bifunctional aspartate kinase/diaminopimelate decarboxylase [Gammaproteobacteria bacterium]|jgi:diaminopimelate decarboxylase/aspartate kinase|nr:bifunctional aspartate kinase/diaminopimelate decarboxylase [Gammaproteobacteria bacterium]